MAVATGLLLVCSLVLVLSATTRAQNTPFHDADGVPVFPFGYYQYTVTSPSDKTNPALEARHGMNLVCPYASSAAPDDNWWSSMHAFMDRALETGTLVHFQLIAFEKAQCDNATLTNLTLQINAFKNHPALLAWYLADEPDGQGIAPNLLQCKYDLIKKLDPHHPVSMVFCCKSAEPYLTSLDVIMVDPYPIPNAAPASVLTTVESVNNYGKPVLLVPQSFGGGDNWARGPSSGEERLMTYLGLMAEPHAVVGVQYFVRSVDVFPYAASAWSTIRRLAAEMKELNSALLRHQRLTFNITTTTAGGGGGVEAQEAQSSLVGAVYIDRDGSVVVIVANTQNTAAVPFKLSFVWPSTGATAVTALTAAAFASRSSETKATTQNLTATCLFQNRPVTAVQWDSSSSVVTLTDTVDGGYGVMVYRVTRQRTTATTAELIYNPSYEENVNAAVPDGNYISVGDNNDPAATFFSDTRLSVHGLHSLRLHAPSAGEGVHLSPYTLHGVTPSTTYTFSCYIKGQTASIATVAFVFNDNIFKALIPAQQTFLVNASGTWTQHSLKLVSSPQVSKACPYGCRGWLSYSLVSAGTVWLDSLSLMATPTPTAAPTSTLQTHTKTQTHNTHTPQI